MIQLTRIPLPSDLNDRLAKLAKEVSEAPQDARMIWNRTTTRRHVRSRLSQALHEMATGIDQCMYCGDENGSDIDHHEPIARNPLRTFDWLNHLLACSTCNSGKKRDQFPVDESGRPLLIDPTAEDPFDHLLLFLEDGEYKPLSDKGKATIRVCDLNRKSLPRARMRARRDVEICLMMWAIAHDEGNQALKRKTVLNIQEQPYADVCQSMLRQAVRPLAEEAFANSPHLLVILRDPEVRAALLA